MYPAGVEAGEKAFGWYRRRIPMKRIVAVEQDTRIASRIDVWRLGTAPDRSSLVLPAARLIVEEALEGAVCGLKPFSPTAAHIALTFSEGYAENCFWMCLVKDIPANL
jgi:hypothetical protein